MKNRKRHKVIVVNDDPFQLRMMSKVLEKDGLDVLSCQSAEEAIRILNQQGPVDAIVTDLYMPGIDGWRFCRLLRSTEYASFNNIPILVVSATFTGEDAAQVTTDLGANAFLAAPYESSVLRDHVRALLENKTLHTCKNVLILVCSETGSHDLRCTFETHGYRAYAASSSKEARSLFQKYSPAIIIIDCQFPGIKTTQLLKDFKQSGISTVTVVLMNDHDPARALQLMSEGVDGHVRKPFDPEYLVILCEKICREQSLVRVEQLLDERTHKLQVSERTYRLLLDSVPDIVIVHDAKGIILHINDVGADRLGWSVKKLIGKSLKDIVLPYYASKISGHVKQTVNNGTCNFETAYITSTGQIIEAEVNERPIEFEGKQAILSVGRDITKRKQAEAERMLLSTAVEQATDIIIITDTEGNIQYVNPAFERITGYVSDEVLGQNMNILKSGKYNEKFYREMWDILKKDKVWTGHIVNKKQDDTLFEVDATITPIRNAQDEIVNYVAVKRDVTQEVAMEEQFRQSRKMEELGSLAGGVAHDFNNLLTGILGYVSILKVNADEGNEVFRAASVIEKAAQRAAQLTGQLLGFARRGKHQNVPVDLSKSVQAVANLLSRTIEKNIVITQNLKEDSFFALGDPGQIEQVILNLAVNARDAMPEGGKLIFDLETVEFDKYYCKLHPDAVPGQNVMVSITDTGHGIQKNIKERIFEPFFTTKEQGKGTGMGLAMVYGIVKNHGGSIQVYSEIGHGSTFRVYLPLASEPAITDAVSRHESLITGTGHILVVDDEEVIRQMAKDLLSHLGYDVTVVPDGLKAVDHYKKFSDEIDLILLDMVMPKLGGRDCFRALKKINPDVKAILSTGYSLDSAVHEILDEGIIAFAQKPYQIKQLAEVVAYALKQ